MLFDVIPGSSWARHYSRKCVLGQGGEVFSIDMRDAQLSLVLKKSDDGLMSDTDLRAQGQGTDSQGQGISEQAQPLGIAVVTVSDTRTIETDKSGATLIEFVESAGHRLVERVIVTDDEALIRNCVLQFQAREDVDVILVTGGTGITLRDVTPEAIAPLVTKLIPGFGELFRMLSYEDIGAATIQSRTMAALCGRVLVFALPGSTGAIRLAVEKILRPQLDSRTRPCNFVQLLPRVR